MWDGNEKKPIGQYLILTFLIAWVSEIILIFGEKSGIIAGNAGLVIHFIVIGFGAGLAPMYATYIVLKTHKQITGIKDFSKRVFKTENILKTAVITIAFCVSQLTLYMICSKYLGEPWYLFILYVPLMILGGGLEEIGWRGFFQPALEEKFPFAISTFIMGLLWAVWHLPLWFVPYASQSSMNFLSFSIQCVALSFVLATLYKLTKNVFAVVLLHAWGNTLGGMFTLDILTKPIDIKLITIYIVEIIAAIIVFTIIDKKKQNNRERAN